MVHMCGHTILHNYSVIIFCDGETSEIFLTTRALIYADLMGDYCDSWKVFTGPLTNVREHCGQFSSGLISNGDFANSFHNIACWEYEANYCPPLFFDPRVLKLYIVNIYRKVIGIV